VERVQSLLDHIEQHARRQFLVEAATGSTWTYAETHEVACALAAELRVRGIGRGDRVAMVLTSSAEFAFLYFACLYLGAIAVPVNPQLHRREINLILKAAQVKLLIDSPATADLIDHDHGTKRLRLRPAADAARGAGDVADSWSLASPRLDAPGWRPLAGVAPDDLLSITFTSGTTSVPKGVPHRISGLLGNAAAFNAELGFGPDNRFLHVMTMGYMAGFLNTLLCPFMAGASVVLARTFDAQAALRFWQPVIQYEADTFWLSPTMLVALLRVDRDSAGAEYCRRKVKTICVGTAPLPLRVKRDFEAKYGVEVFESYGLSELLLISGNSRRFPRRDLSVGRLLPNIGVRVEPDGEIAIKTPYVMAGYLNAQTAQPDPSSVPEWFPTGDLGHVSADGDLFITGRKKDLIIRGGINISPRAVEEVLLEHEAVAQVAVVGLPHDFYGEEVAAAVLFKPGHSLATARGSLEDLCRERLSKTAVPTRFVAVDELPSANGKVQKHKVREQLLAVVDE
jgi:long-chain acyl-CoA synthetase